MAAAEQASRAELRAEAASLAADDDDRAEAAQVLRDMEACVHGDIHQLRAPRNGRGHEQSGPRFAIVVQSDTLPLSTLLVSPTSTAARPATFRPEVNIFGHTTRVLAEQTAVVDPNGSATTWAI